MRLLTTVLLALLGFVFAPLALAAFASINPSVSEALLLLSAVEGTLASRLTFGSWTLASLDAFWRGLAYLVTACACFWGAAYLKPRPPLGSP